MTPKPDLLTLIEEEEAQALGPENGSLAIERATALSYYLGEPFGNEVDGRSQVVSKDVAETIEWIKPSLLRIFMSGDAVVKFDPHGPEDEEQADQESDYVNYIITQKNNGFNIFYVWFTDALLSKNGYVKAYWEEHEEQVKERYEDLTEEEYLMILGDDTVEPIEHSAEEKIVTIMTPQGPMQQSMVMHDVVVQRKSDIGKCEICNIPPENVLVSANHTTVGLQNCSFVEHFEWKTISELREEGYDVPDNIGGNDTLNLEETERLEFYENLRTDSADPSMRLVKVREAYIRSDQDGDGIAELHRVVVVGTTILEDEEVDIIPIACISPTMLPHRHVGRSVADDVMDIQLRKSIIERQLFDNMYIANNIGYAVSDKVNLDDMLVSRPGRIVRMEDGAMPGQGHIQELRGQLLGAESYSLLDYIDAQKEARTGVTKYNQGLDANSLNKTFGGISQIMSAAQQRLEMIARVFAETGVKELFSIVHSVLLKHAKKEEIIKLRNKWVPVDPREWVKRTDMTISVGLGNGNKDQMLSHLQMILQAQTAFQNTGIVTPHNIFNALERLAQNAGFKSPEEFFTDPSNNPQQPQQQDPRVIKAQSDAQISQQKAQQDMQTQNMQTQNDIQTAQAKAQADIMMQWEKASAEIEIAKAKTIADLQAKNMKAMNG